uniref:Uncharacterized protein n=1 Tax=Ditylenchus dipsaci TaxID=166011 RepID=A0A915EM68_9BILA
MELLESRAVSFNQSVKITAPHTHHGDKARVELKRMQGSVQKQAIDSRDPPRAIIGKAIQEVAQDAQPFHSTIAYGKEHPLQKT